MNTTELIEKYLEGSLTADEKAVVEARASSDEGFRKLIELHREVNESIADTELYDLHKKLAELSSEYMTNLKETNPEKKPGIYILRIAAILLVIAGSAAVLRYAVFNPPVEKLIYSRYYISYDADDVTRSEPSEGLYSKALDKYSSKDYTDAFALFSEVTADDPYNYHAWFYRGITCMELSDHENAVLSFSRIPEDWNSPYREHRDWYYALSLIYLQKTTEALVILDKIISQDGYYVDKSVKIRTKLTR